MQRRALNLPHSDISNKGEITPQTLEEHRLLIIPAPKAKFNSNEFDAIRAFVAQRGGSLLYLGSEGRDNGPFGTNFNYLLEEFGVSVNPDAVVRTAYAQRYFHPKEALVTNGILNREMLRAANKESDDGAVGVASTGVGHVRGKIPQKYEPCNGKKGRAGD